MMKGNDSVSSRDVILYIFFYAGGKISGRTAIQKLAYFTAVKGILKIQFRPHYYGPYSSEVTGILDQLTEVNILEEKSERTSTKSSSNSVDWKKYLYSLTTEGEKYLTYMDINSPDAETIRDIVHICQRETDLDIGSLSWAAKVHYILTHDGNYDSSAYHSSESQFRSEEIKFDIIQKMACELNWKLDDSQIRQAFSLINSLHLL